MCNDEAGPHNMFDPPDLTVQWSDLFTVMFPGPIYCPTHTHITWGLLSFPNNADLSFCHAFAQNPARKEQEQNFSIAYFTNVTINVVFSFWYSWAEKVIIIFY